MDFQTDYLDFGGRVLMIPPHKKLNESSRTIELPKLINVPGLCKVLPSFWEIEANKYQNVIRVAQKSSIFNQSPIPKQPSQKKTFTYKPPKICENQHPVKRPSKKLKACPAPLTQYQIKNPLNSLSSFEGVKRDNHDQIWANAVRGQSPLLVDSLPFKNSITPSTRQIIMYRESSRIEDKISQKHPDVKKRKRDEEISFSGQGTIIMHTAIMVWAFKAGATVQRNFTYDSFHYQNLYNSPAGGKKREKNKGFYIDEKIIFFNLLREEISKAVTEKTMLVDFQILAEKVCKANPSITSKATVCNFFKKRKRKLPECFFQMTPLMIKFFLNVTEFYEDVNYINSQTTHIPKWELQKIIHENNNLR